jgi:S1-C subfamily serine protease
VQRGYLGINYRDIEQMTEEEKKQEGVTATTDGVYVTGVSSDGGATAAGIKKGDIITKVNNAVVNSGIQLSAQLANFRPGDKIPLTYLRGNKEYTTTVTLKKRTDLASTNIGTRIGAELATLDKTKARQYGIAGGVVVNKITEGGPVGRTRMQTSFIITSVNGQDVTTVEELSAILSQITGPVQVEGIYPGYDGTYKYPLNLEE